MQLIVLGEAVKRITPIHLYCLCYSNTPWARPFLYSASQEDCDLSEQRWQLLFPHKYLTKALKCLCFVPLKAIFLSDIFCTHSPLEMLYYVR